MIKLIKGNLLDSTAPLIAHGVNCQGVMGSGVAKTICTKWPDVKSKYVEYVNMTRKSVNPEELLGSILYVKIAPGRRVANCFTQQNYGRDGQVYFSYISLGSCLTLLREKCIEKNIRRISMPEIGCGLAGGNRESIMKRIEKAFDKTPITVEIYHL